MSVQLISMYLFKNSYHEVIHIRIGFAPFNSSYWYTILCYDIKTNHCADKFLIVTKSNCYAE